MIKIDDSYLEDEIRDGFYIPSMTKRTWAMELTVLDLIDTICKKHNITYFADWGTYLGALRHAGFVPWDDDMDICMHRNEFEKFKQAAESELPDGYSIMSFHNNDYSWKFIYNIVPNDHMCFEPEYLKSHYSFPYIVAIDIFIIDNISDDAELEKSRNEEIKSLLNKADRIILSDKNPDSEKLEKKRSIYAEVEKLLRIENTNDTEKVIQKIPWGVYDGRSYDKKLFEESVRVPFEMTTIPVPLCYNQVISSKYGDFMNVIVGGGGHDYPYYKGQKTALGEEFDYPRSYKFNEADLRECEKDYSASLKTIAADMKEYLCDSVEILTEVAGNLSDGVGFNEPDNLSKDDVLAYLTDLQQNIINFGTLIESVKGENTATVSELEAYCEAVFDISQRLCELGVNRDIILSKLVKSLSDIVDSVLEKIDREIINRRSVLFLPVKSKYWETLKSAYEKEISDINTDVYVMPLPYFYREYDGSFKEKMNLEADEFRALGLNICNYDQFDISLLCPEVIYINNPYDEYNMAMSVPSIFYSRIIRKYTEKLVYIPSFKSMEFDKSNYPCFYNMQYYCTVPGVVLADEVYLQSESTKAVYMEKLNEWAGTTDYSGLWNQKLIVTDECKNADASNSKVSNSTERKTLIWYISVGTVIEYGDEYFEKTYRNMEVFSKSRENINIILLTDSFTDDVLEKNRPELYKKWTDFKMIFLNNKIGHIENVKDIGLDEIRKKALNFDAYYGDPSVICKDFCIAKKPVMLQNIRV